MTRPTIAAGFCIGLLRFACEQGCEEADLLARSGLCKEDLSGPEERIELARYLRLMEAAIEATGNPALALHFGEKVRMSEMSVAALIGQSAKTAGEAIVQVNRYSRLLVDAGYGNPADILSVEPAGTDVWLVRQPITDVQSHWLTESSFARMCVGMKYNCDGNFRPKAFEFRHAAPGYVDEYRRIFSAPLHFEASRDAMLVEAAILAAPLVYSNDYAVALFSDYANRLIEEARLASGTFGEVRKYLIERLHTGDVSMDVVARNLGRSRQQLYRQLQSEGHNFAELLAGLRDDLARQYLQDGRPVAEVAYLVGYSDISSFSRAFKNRVGMRPGQYRTASAGQSPGFEELERVKGIEPSS